MTREQIVELVKKMSNHTVENGCTPAEAAAFAAKVAQLTERYHIEEAELRGAAPLPEQIEVCQEHYWTDKQTHITGVTELIAGLADGMSCRVIILHRKDQGVFKQAGYGVVGEVMDARMVVMLTRHLLPQLIVMARLKGIGNGYEKAGLIRWCNQFLAGAASEIRARLLKDRRARSEQQEADKRASSTALICTGDSIAKIKQEAAEKEFKRLYPRTRTQRSNAGYDGDARQAGRAAGRNIGLDLPLGGGEKPRNLN